MSQAPSILTSIHGRAFGLGRKGELIVNNTAGQLVDAQATVNAVVRLTIANALVLALNATPFEMVAAPGVGKTLVCNRCVASKAAGVAFTIGAGEDLSITSDGGAEVFTRIDSDSFLDSTADEIRFGDRPIAHADSIDLTALQNLALVATILVGEVTTGDSDLIVEVHYQIFDNLLT